jgi:hypothetical protein
MTENADTRIAALEQQIKLLWSALALSFFATVALGAVFLVGRLAEQQPQPVTAFHQLNIGPSAKGNQLLITGGGLRIVNKDGKVLTALQTDEQHASFWIEGKGQVDTAQ